MKRLMRVVCASFGVAASTAMAQAEKISVHVYDVANGDTITVKLRRKPVKVHLWGIAAPLPSRSYGAQAKKYLSDLIRGKDVIVDIRSIQSKAEIVGKVMWTRPPSAKPMVPAPPVDVDREMVSVGLAWWNPTVAPSAKDLKDAQGQAKRGKKGLWADPHPVAPWAGVKPKAQPPVKPPAKPPAKPPVGPKR